MAKPFEKEKNDFSNQSLDEICKFVGADSLAYLSLEGLFKALGETPQAKEKSFCAACFDGRYPTPLFNANEIQN